VGDFSFICGEGEIPVSEQTSGFTCEAKLISSNPVMERSIARNIARQHETVVLRIPECKSEISQQISRKFVTPAPVGLGDIQWRRILFCAQPCGQVRVTYQSSGEEKDELIVYAGENIIAAGECDPFILPEGMG